MKGISRQLEQRVVRRNYYRGEICPTPAQLKRIIEVHVPKVRGFDLIDIAGAPGFDEFGTPCFQYVCLYQRDGTTLEAKAGIAADKAMGIDPDGKERG